MAGEKCDITEEQRKRMEHNRKRALEIRNQKIQNKRMNSTLGGKSKQNRPISRDLSYLVTPPPARNNNIVDLVKNPYETTKQCHVVRSRQIHPSPEQHHPQGRNAVNVIQNSSTSLQSNEMNVLCEICGFKLMSKELCIRWWHTSQLNLNGRYSCCGRLKGQPCYVGRHAPESNSSGIQPSTAGINSQLVRGKTLLVQCKCKDDLQARIRRTKKENEQQGRLFFQCSSEKRPRCKYFQYVDELFNVNKTMNRVTPDGIKEWECPYAFWMLDTPNQPSSGHGGIAEENQRENIIMAMLVSEMFKYAGGQHGWTCSAICKDTLVTRAMKQFNEGNFHQKLGALTPSQVKRLFGLSNNQKMKQTTNEECSKLMERLMKENSFVRSTVFMTERSAGRIYYDLTGLEAFVNI
mmetsp:Transcript_31709/g.63813  ORF Transcript_31709/g.63813 Transcript_31709/m.63813 type:complete len:407 (-) Transcript_31709:48-1268(-)